MMLSEWLLKRFRRLSARHKRVFFIELKSNPIGLRNSLVEQIHASWWREYWIDCEGYTLPGVVEESVDEAVAKIREQFAAEIRAIPA
ncbi:MAG: hypothetical protein WC711_02075 [Candidatus Staskawiczbacteria bacterium]|jgi:hypothetical protein